MIRLQPATYRDQTFTETVQADGAGFEFIGCEFHGGLCWMGSGSGSVRECVFRATPEMHGLYTHNHCGGAREVSRCLFEYQPGRWGLHIYSGGANWLKDYRVHDCVHLGLVQIGGSYGVIGLDYRDNLHLSTYAGFGMHAEAHARNSGNLLVGNTFVNPAGIDIAPGFEVGDGNTIYAIGYDQSRKDMRTRAIESRMSWFVHFHEARRFGGIYAECVNGIASARVIARETEFIRKPMRWGLVALAALVALRRRNNGNKRVDETALQY